MLPEPRVRLLFGWSTSANDCAAFKGLVKLAQHWPRRLIGQTDPFPRAGAYSVQSSLATESRFLALTRSRCART